MNKLGAQTSSAETSMQGLGRWFRARVLAVGWQDPLQYWVGGSGSSALIIGGTQEAKTGYFQSKLPSETSSISELWV